MLSFFFFVKEKDRKNRSRGVSRRTLCFSVAADAYRCDVFHSMRIKYGEGATNVGYPRISRVISRLSSA